MAPRGKGKGKQAPPLKRDTRQEKRKQIEDSLVVLEKAIDEFVRRNAGSMVGNSWMGNTDI